MNYFNSRQLPEQIAFNLFYFIYFDIISCRFSNEKLLYTYHVFKVGYSLL
jgi:hypothetical protein